jgi:2,3-dimethylmalate lyase
LPGVADGLTAKIAERAGFDAITCGGYASTAALLGQPDTSQLGMTEMAEHYSRICDAIEVPVFADADTGFGNATNVHRAVRAYERAGVAGLFIEDQVFPKRCGHMAGKAVIPLQEMVVKLQAALDARVDADMVIMARTDALAVNGIDDALQRAVTLRETGADLIFVESPTDIDQMRRICAEIDAPCLANNIEGGQSPVLSAATLQEIGYAAVAFPVATSYTIAKAVQRLMHALKSDGTTDAVTDGMLRFDEFNELVGLSALRSREQQWLDQAHRRMENTAADGSR